MAELTADMDRSRGDNPLALRSPSVRSRRLPRRALALAAAVTAVAAIPVATMRDRDPAVRSVAMVPVAQFLDTAATVAAVGEDVVPHGDQFVYGKAVETDGTWRETWYSVDQPGPELEGRHRPGGNRRGMGLSRRILSPGSCGFSMRGRMSCSVLRATRW